ncbi:MAG: hypothetical protein ABEK12_02355 [Candidatus Nanohaloarchaea archaeon]
MNGDPGPVADPYTLLTDDTDYPTETVLQALGSNPRYRLDEEESGDSRWVYRHPFGGHITYYPKDDVFVPLIPNDPEASDTLYEMVRDGEAGDIVQPVTPDAVRQVQAEKLSPVAEEDGWTYHVDGRDVCLRYDPDGRRAALVPGPDWQVEDGTVVPPGEPDIFRLEGSPAAVRAYRETLNELVMREDADLRSPDRDTYIAPRQGVEVTFGDGTSQVMVQIWPDGSDDDGKILDPELRHAFTVRNVVVSGDGPSEFMHAGSRSVVPVER